MAMSAIDKVYLEKEKIKVSKMDTLKRHLQKETLRRQKSEEVSAFESSTLPSISAVAIMMILFILKQKMMHQKFIVTV